MEREHVFSMFGIPLFGWDEWDSFGDDSISFYEVEFLHASMTRYNGEDVTVGTDGLLEIGWKGSDEDGEPRWSGYVVEIPEVLQEINRRYGK